MAAAYKIEVFLCLLIAVFGYTEAQHCSQIFNVEKCAIDIFCESQFITNRGLDDYSINNYNSEIYDRRTMENCDTIPFKQQIYYPIHLIYKDKIIRTGQHNVPYYERYNYERDNVINIITYMDLSNNRYEIMPTFNHMENLVALNLSYNSLSSIELPNMDILPALTEIDVSHNSIVDIVYFSDTGHTHSKLKKMNLSYNHIETFANGMFEPLKELQTVDISHNNIKGIDKMSFEGLKLLKELNLSYNLIADVNSSFFRFVRLENLDLSFNNIKSIKASDFNMMINMKTLDLSHNAIANIEMGTFNNMNSLSTLSLNNNQLANLDINSFCKAIFLLNIDISNNFFKTLPKGIFKNKTIHDFSIKDNILEGAIDRGTFEGLSYIHELDLSYQLLDSVEDDAFFGLDKVEVILLNNNKIRKITFKAFRMKPTLKTLDLAYNQLENIDFDKTDLYYLNALLLRNNKLTVVKQEHFHGLNSLQFLDLSDNIITQVETNSFLSLKELINFEISNNPLNGTLKENTFEGLSSLPSLDISQTLIRSVENASFSGMVHLKVLNVSHSKINFLEYNSFVHTGILETIDLSFNELKEFVINSTELLKLCKLFLNNNFLKTLNFETFTTLTKLAEFSLSHNMLENIEAHTFVNQKDLFALDLSYNPLTVSKLLLKQTKSISTLNLSGIRKPISFSDIKDIFVTLLILSNSSISEIKSLHMNNLQRLESLTLSRNVISKLEYNGFANITKLKNLDLSYNKITYIQPGTFMDNTLLYSINLAHNLLTNIPYGMFKGLIYLSTLDISYNHVRELVDERFYGAQRLNRLIADHNEIVSIGTQEFEGTSLTYLSIGDNPIPCEQLVNLNRSGVSFDISTNNLDYTSNENVHGISCNRKTSLATINFTHPTSGDETKVLVNIRDILLNQFNNQASSNRTNESDQYILTKITDHIEKMNSNVDGKILQLMNSEQKVDSNTNKTNILLEKILKLLTITASRKSPPVEVPKGNATYDNLIKYINKIKQDLEDSLTLEKANIENEIEAKVAIMHSQLQSKLTTEAPKSDKQTVDSSDSKYNIFTVTCVSLILGILVSFALYKIFKSNILVGEGYAVSTRELTASMDSGL